jgi:hypothetical protein
MTPYPAPQRKGDPLEAQAKMEQAALPRITGIKAPSAPPKEELFMNPRMSPLFQDKARQMQGRQEWEGMTPNERLMEVTSTAADVADWPFAAGSAMLMGSPKTVQALTEGLESIIKRAPESSIALWAREALDPENMRNVLKGLKDIPEEWMEKLGKRDLPVGREYTGLFDIHKEKPSIWLNMKRGDVLEDTARHEITHAWWRQAPKETKKVWYRTIDELGRHPQVREGLSTASTASESLSRTMEDLLAGRTNKWVTDLKMAMGID